MSRLVGMPRVSIRAAALAAGLVAMAFPVVAADLDATVIPALPEAALAEDGVPCEAPIVKSFPVVWLGHFTGGYSHYTGPGGVIVTDWRDEKLCFPARRACDRYIHVMRQDYHKPEGYFTCLPIR